VFYTAQAFLVGRNLRFVKHSAVISSFGHEFAKNDEVLREFHHGMIDAQDARNVGDYQVDAILSEEDVRIHLDRADQFIDLAEQTR
jgi:uncharacterized protein